MKILDQTFRTLERALDVRMTRQGLLAGNLANVNTPGFTPRELDFAAAMGETGAASSGGGLAGSAPLAQPEPLAGELPLDLVGRPTSSLSGALARPGGSAATFGGSTSTSPGLDGNAVDADRTLVALSENAIQYGAAAKAISKKFAILRYVASDGNA
jgi:flagellar basal-body rod protein FlgB